MDPGEIPAIERLRVSSKRPINASHRNAYERNTNRASEGLRFPKDASESHCLIIGVSPQRNLETTRALEGLHVPTELFSLSFFSSCLDPFSFLSSTTAVDRNPCVLKN